MQNRQLDCKGAADNVRRREPKNDLHMLPEENEV
jgi:hypothetical protein